MSFEQLEQRVAALEQAVADIQTHLPQVNGPSIAEKREESEFTDNPMLPGIEYPLVLSTPRRRLGRVKVQVRIVGRRLDTPGLALSEEEWAALGLEEDDE